MSQQRKSTRNPKIKEESLNSLFDRKSDINMGYNIFYCPSKGRGIITTEDRCKGDVILEYWGELLEIKYAKARENQYSRLGLKSSYMFYFKYDSKHYCIDATHENGRYGRLINHSKSLQNLTPKIIKRPSGELKLYFVAKMNIAANSELYYDYHDNRPSILAAHPWLSK